MIWLPGREVSKLNLLIVEDEKEILNGIMAGVRWEEIGIDMVCEATSMETAVRQFDLNRIDMVLCDIELPDGSGLDFLEWVKERQPAAVSMIMTCHEEFDYAKRAVSLGCRDFIVKPIIYDQLEEKLLSVRQEIMESQENHRYQAYGREWMKQMSGEQEGSLSTANKKELIGQVKSYITAHLKEDLRMEQMARQFCISADYLSKLFKREEGIGIGDYIVDERMFLAAQLLKVGRANVSRIAYECGYDNYSYFTKVFKKKYGMTPREYMQKAGDMKDGSRD